MGTSGFWLWQNADPRLANVEMTTNFGSVDVATATTIDAVVADQEPVDEFSGSVAPNANAVVVAPVKTVSATGTTGTIVTPNSTSAATSTESTVPEQAVVTTDTANTADPGPVSRTIAVSIFGPAVQPTCSVPVAATTTVHKVMLAASRQCGFSYAGEKQGSLGFFVKEIAGLKQNVKQGYYWVFAVNGEKSQLGVSTRTVEPGDSIQWMYEAEY